MLTRSNPREITERAHRAYNEGKPSREVLTEIYEVDLPLEAYVFQRSYPRDHDFLVDRYFHPWALIEMASTHIASRPCPLIDEHLARLELDALEANPDFLPLMSLQAGDTNYDGYVIGYSLEELRRGNSAIFGHHEKGSARIAELRRFGDSLLAVLHQWMTDYCRMEKGKRADPANRRRPYDNLESAEKWLKAVEKLQRKLAEQQASS